MAMCVAGRVTSAVVLSGRHNAMCKATGLVTTLGVFDLKPLTETVGVEYQLGRTGMVWVRVRGGYEAQVATTLLLAWVLDAVEIPLVTPGASSTGAGRRRCCKPKMSSRLRIRHKRAIPYHQQIVGGRSSSG